MEQMQIISKVYEPTEWCAGIVVVQKANGKVRGSNQAQRKCSEYYPLPSVDHTLPQLPGATIFGKLDAKIGFWQIRLIPRVR